MRLPAPGPALGEAGRGKEETGRPEKAPVLASSVESDLLPLGPPRRVLRMLGWSSFGCKGVPLKGRRDCKRGREREREREQEEGGSVILRVPPEGDRPRRDCKETSAPSRGSSPLSLEEDRPRREGAGIFSPGPSRPVSARAGEERVRSGTPLWAPPGGVSGEAEGGGPSISVITNVSGHQCQ